jgi:hypothetical protein
VNVLDENIPASQRQLLIGWGLHVQQVGLDWGRAGMLDEQIVPQLIQSSRPTFFTRDEDFFDHRLCHQGYCLVYLAVERNEVALFVRRVLRHPALTTKAKRMGNVVRASTAGLQVWRRNAAAEEDIPWSP